jgi:hypothetical protein
MKRLLASFSCALLFSALSPCQVSTSLSTGPRGMQGTMRFYPPDFRGLVIAGAPYSAEKVDEHVQTLEDGTHINQTYPVTKVYRDSMGRTRTERPVPRGPMERRANQPEGPTVVEINDPVAGVRYIFVSDEPVAHRQELPAANSRGRFPRRSPSQVAVSGGTDMVFVARGIDETETPPAPTVRAVAVTGKRHAADDRVGPQTTMEDLGTQTIEGIEVEGKRHTLTWPVGAMGNDRPITNTSETWTSPDLKEVILRKSNDPRSGEHTYKLVNINRNAPDSSLFEPPPGYAVKDETGDFTIHWGPIYY